MEIKNEIQEPFDSRLCMYLFSMLGLVTMLTLRKLRSWPWKKSVMLKHIHIASYILCLLFSVLNFVHPYTAAHKQATKKSEKRNP